MWSKDFAWFDAGNKIYLSVVFTWHLPRVREFVGKQNKKVVVGGPAVRLMPDHLSDCAEVDVGDSKYNMLAFHNPLATFTSRGCVNKCSFCAVPKIEGRFKELKSWIANPIVCDNNLLACSDKHFGKVVDSLRSFDFCDFNQGLDCRLIRPFHVDLLVSLKRPMIRFAFDDMEVEGKLMDAISLVESKGLKVAGCYVLVGFDDIFEDAKHKVELLLEKKIRPFPMRFRPLDCLDLKDLQDPVGWPKGEMQKFTRYYSRLNWASKVPYDEFINSSRDVKKQNVGFGLLGEYV